MVDFKGILPTKEDRKVDYFWSLIIEPGWVQAGIWSVKEGKVAIASKSSSVAWGDDAEIISSTDAALSSAIQNFPEDAKEPSQVVFGVSGSWVSEGNIKTEYLDKIKNICSELSLKPSGFVVLSEAIAYYIKSEEEAPLTGLVIGVFAESLEITQFKIGKVVGSTIVSRSVSVADDVAEGLSRLSLDGNFPSRFVVYDGKEGDLEEARQSILDAKWDDFEKIKFLHAPKVELITPEKKIIATSLAGGMEIAGAKSVDKLKPDVDQPDQINSSRELNETDELNAADVGFVLGEDVKDITNKDAKNQPEQDETSKPDLVSDAAPEIVEGRTNIQVNQNKASLFVKIKDKISSVFNRIVDLLAGASNNRRPFSKKATPSRRLIIAGVVFFGLLLGGGFALWWFVPKAVVKIYVSPQKLDETTSITVDEKSNAVDLEKKIIPGLIESTSVESDKTKSTSGTKTVGERAKGEVTLYRSGNQITVDKGTVLKSGNGLAFTLDEDASVASGSASSPGTTKVGVTAESIGSDSNLASGESFDVGNYPSSDLEAKNENTFTGGSSREVSVVSEDDQASLEEELTGEIVDTAIEKIQSDLSSDLMLIKDSVKTEIIKKEFDKKVGDEGGTLKLDLELKVSVLTIKSEDLAKLAEEVLKGKVSEGYTLKSNQIKYEFDYKEGEGAKHLLDVKLSANLLPKVDTNEIKKNITGKYSAVASTYLTDVKGFKKAQIEITPKLPGRLNTLPRLSQNISIEVEAY